MRRISMTVRPGSGIRIVIPYFASIRQAEQLIAIKNGWLENQLEHLADIDKNLTGLPPLPKEEAKAILRKRTEELAQKFNLPYNRIAFRQQKTRWGSCSFKGNINLNLRLYFLPSELQDYVILHELAHTRYHNHGPQFWQLLDQLTGAARSLNHQLKKFNYLLYLPPVN